MNETAKVTVLMELPFYCVEADMKWFKISEVILSHRVYREEKERRMQEVNGGAVNVPLIGLPTKAFLSTS